VIWSGCERHAIEYAQFYSRSHDAVIRVYDEAGNVIETHEQAGEFKSGESLQGAPQPIEHDSIPPKPWKNWWKAAPRLLASFDVSAVNCSLQFFTADLYAVGGASLRRPASTVIKFRPSNPADDFQ
jgi:hypothetical protein